MRRQHVVVGRNDGEIGPPPGAQIGFVVGRRSGKGVSQIGTRDPRPNRSRLGGIGSTLQIGIPRNEAAGLYAFGDGADDGM
ncbi:hypothetical protein WQQ_22730 [Hydrocarboniphaga effusa AP103]|uniref:Uncharacterized protein n=1 Tax=Hydrocarboniphaga effusa AP103 TaxID=1172194 RepID=I8I646_9GAMM|nr:hypothetical protein WQQ_22730 [Hydrocarboniphaga effusa AP103]